MAHRASRRAASSILRSVIRPRRSWVYRKMRKIADSKRVFENTGSTLLPLVPRLPPGNAPHTRLRLCLCLCGRAQPIRTRFSSRIVEAVKWDRVSGGRASKTMCSQAGAWEREENTSLTLPNWTAPLSAAELDVRRLAASRRRRRASGRSRRLRLAVKRDFGLVPRLLPGTALSPRLHLHVATTVNDDTNERE